MSAIDDQNALGIDCASATRRPGARPTQFGTLSPSAGHPCSPATQTNCAHALSLCVLSARRAQLPPPELCTRLHFFMLIVIDAAPESYALVNSHCCDTIRMSFVNFVAFHSSQSCAKHSKAAPNAALLAKTLQPRWQSWSTKQPVKALDFKLPKPCCQALQPCCRI